MLLSPGRQRAIALTTKEEQMKKLMDKESTLIFKCWKMKRSTKVAIVTVLLILALFAERYCFMVSVYKTKFFGYVLILIVIFLNSVFNLLNVQLRKKRHKSRLHEMFNIERTPKIGLFVISLIG